MKTKVFWLFLQQLISYFLWLISNKENESGAEGLFDYKCIVLVMNYLMEVYRWMVIVFKYLTATWPTQSGRHRVCLFSGQCKHSPVRRNATITLAVWQQTNQQRLTPLPTRDVRWMRTYLTWFAGPHSYRTYHMPDRGFAFRNYWVKL